MGFLLFRIAKRRLAAAMALLFVFSMTPQLARAQYYSDSNYDDDIDQVVARVSFVQGPVSYSRGDDPDDWDPALVNIPFGLGDRLYSSTDGRAELSLPGGNFVRVGRRSYVTALTLTYDTKQFYVGNGAATFTVRRLGRDEVFEIDTPSVAVTVDQPGRYRVEVDDNGDTRVIVRSGLAFVAANGRQVTVERAEMDVYGLDAAEYDIVRLRQADNFDRWVDERQARFDARFRTAYQYADEDVIGVDELADYGRWEQIPDYGYAWTPTNVAVGWQPFTVGHWYWQDPWGWTWISEEPWGWAPCHYGRWTYYRSRWYWVPLRGRVEVVRYAPAVVEFVTVGGNIGWFPLHPRDHFVPWWVRRDRVVENVTFVNRTRVIVVDERTFVSSRRVTTSIIRDATIIREATTVRISDRRFPVPQRESIRVSAERRQVERPSQTIVSRPVVVRTAPLPPPPRFDEKVRVIRERQGQPLTTREIVDMGAKDFKSNRRIQIKTVTETKTDFKARGGQGGQSVQSQPVAALKGRNLATSDNPIKTEVTRRQEQRDDRQQQKAQEQQQRDQDQLQKKQERDQKQIQDQQRKDQEQQQRDLQKKQQEQDRLQKQQQQDQERKDRQLQDQQRKDLERKQQEQDQFQKKQERDQKQIQDQQRKDQEQQQRDLQKKQQEQDRLKQQQQDQERKDRESKQQQDELRRKQLQDEQQKQRQLQQDQQRQQQQLQQDQKKQEQDQRRQELERQRLEKQQQDKNGRDLQQPPRDQQPPQDRKGPPADDRTPPGKERKDRDAPPPLPPGPPPGGPPPR
jgi:DNA segregation ATPase FtsK/SpoIIIE-like protein